MTLGRDVLNEDVRERLAGMAAEMRGLVYGELGHPEWGTRFAEIEADGMAVGLELARLLMEQSVSDQAGAVSDQAGSVADEAGEGTAEALVVGEGDEREVAVPTGSAEARLETGAGAVRWDEPTAYLARRRRAFSPSAEGLGDRRGGDALAEPAGAGDVRGNDPAIVPAGEGGDRGVAGDAADDQEGGTADRADRHGALRRT